MAPRARKARRNSGRAEEGSRKGEEMKPSGVRSRCQRYSTPINREPYSLSLAVSHLVILSAGVWELRKPPHLKPGEEILVPYRRGAAKESDLTERKGRSGTSQDDRE